MTRVAGVRFEADGKIFQYDVGNLNPTMGSFVIAHTAKGIDLGEVAMGIREVENFPSGELTTLIRIATEQDIRHAEDNRKKEQEAFVICQQKIAEHKLEMKLVSVEYAYDNSKMLFYFTANGRVDFRALVKDLAYIFKTRIELRQIGVRDEARLIGGLGPCGRPICCRTFLSDFQPVSIKMAKEQSLSLNPTKISGVCGRLMCCLKYEQDQYENARKRMPRIGREVATPDGNGVVTNMNLIKETVSVRIAKGDDTEVKEFPLEQIGRAGCHVEASSSSQAAEAERPEVDFPEIPDEWKNDEPEVKTERPSKGENRKRKPAKPHHVNGKGNAPDQTDQSTETGKQKLGQPVRRENRVKNGKQQPESQDKPKARTVEAAGNDKPDVTDNGEALSIDRAGKQPSRKNNWADALNKAMEAADKKT